MRNWVSWGDTVGGVAPTAVPNAKVEIHKVGLNSTAPAAGDTASFKLQDLGVVETSNCRRLRQIRVRPRRPDRGEVRPGLADDHLSADNHAASGLAIRRAVWHPGVLHGAVPGKSTCGELLLVPRSDGAKRYAKRVKLPRSGSAVEPLDHTANARSRTVLVSVGSKPSRGNSTSRQSPRCAQSVVAKSRTSRSQSGASPSTP
jgi:hypothetical protein